MQAKFLYRRKENRYTTEKIGGIAMIKLNLSELAIKKIEEKLKQNQYVKLTYDTDGCGCGVNGVTALTIGSDLDRYDVQMITNSPFPIYINKGSMIFFDDEMQLDYSETTKSFQLKSKQQMFHSRMSLYEQ